MFDSWEKKFDPYETSYASYTVTYISSRDISPTNHISHKSHRIGWGPGSLKITWGEGALLVAKLEIFDFVQGNPLNGSAVLSIKN